MVVVVVLGSGNSGDELASGDQDKCVDGKKRDKQTQLMVVTRKRHRERAEQTERQTATRRTEVPNEASEITISDSPDHVILPPQPHRGSQGGESARVWLRPLSVINFSSRLGLARQTSKDHPAISTPTHRVSVTIISQPFQS